MRPAYGLFRWVSMFAGMTVLALGIRLQVLADLGLGPWDVLHMGLSRNLPITFGQASQIVGLALVAAAFALREAPRWGTLLNMWYVGAVYDVIEARLPIPRPEGLLLQWLFLLAGVGLLATGSAWYLSAQLGAGPRDGMTLALARRLSALRAGRLSRLLKADGRARHLVRTAPGVAPSRILLEGTALVTGYLLGGPVGPGTVGVAVLIGPSMALCIPRFAFTRRWWTQPAPQGEGGEPSRAPGAAHHLPAPCGSQGCAGAGGSHR